MKVLALLQMQLCLVQAAIFPVILKASENPYFGKVSIDLSSHKSVDLQTVYKFTKFIKLWTAIVISYT